MKTFVGVGKGNAQGAFKQAVQGIGKPAGIIFISEYNMTAEVSKLLNEEYPGVSHIGVTGSSMGNGHVSDDQLVILGLYDDAKLSFGIIEELDSCPMAYIGRLRKSLEEVSANKDNTVCWEFCTNSEEKLISTMQTVVSKNNIPLLGGTAFGIPEGKKSIVAYNGKVYENACVYAVIKNTTGKVRIYKENIYKKRQGAVPHYATKVDISKRALIELDGRPALEVYANELGIAKNQVLQNVFKNPIGRAIGDELYIMSMNQEYMGGFTNYKIANKNDCFYILELDDYKEMEKSTRDKIKSDMRSISLVLSVDCAFRYILYNNEKYTETYAKDMATLGNHIGSFGGGEQYCNQHANQTMVCAVFE